MGTPSCSSATTGGCQQPSYKCNISSNNWSCRYKEKRSILDGLNPHYISATRFWHLERLPWIHQNMLPKNCLPQSGKSKLTCEYSEFFSFFSRCYSIWRPYTCTIVEAWQLLKRALEAGSINSSFTMLHPDVAFVVMMIMFRVFFFQIWPTFTLLSFGLVKSPRMNHQAY